MPLPPGHAQLEQALSHHQAGRLDEAAPLYAQARRMAPRSWEAHQLAGVAELQRQRYAEAVTLLRQAIALKPGAALSWMCAGVAFQSLGRKRDAETHLRESLRLDPKNSEAHANLGALYANTGRSAQAIACYQTSLQLQPDSADTWTGLGNAYLLDSQPGEALRHHEKALSLAPAHAKARASAAQALQQLNRTREAVAAFDEHLRQHPEDLDASSQRLLLLNYLPEWSAQALFEAHVAHGQRVAKRIRPAVTPHATRTGGRPLKVAFLSPDLRTHSVAYFLEPLIRHLDPARFTTLLYHDHFCEDLVSLKLKQQARLWRNFTGQSDTVVEAQIRQDAPDILIDLAGHTGFNRMSLFARKLAPVQLTYLGYPNTTGISGIGFRFTDEIADPFEAQTLHTEKLVRFSRTAWLYQPRHDAPPVAPPPCTQGAPLTFGSFNAANKLSLPTLRAWARILQRVPGSRLLIKSSGLEPTLLDPLFAEAGLDRERVTVRGPVADTTEHLRLYNSVDIALDPFPYNGTTTTCEALWMGVPVVTLTGDRHASRVGTSLVHAIGRPEWAAPDVDRYVETASQLASDPAALAAMRCGQRERMTVSPLLDAPAQAKAFGDALDRCYAEVQV